MPLSKIFNDRKNNIMPKPISDRFWEDSSNYDVLNGNKVASVPNSKTDRTDVR